MTDPVHPADLERWSQAFASLGDHEAATAECPPLDRIWAAARGELAAPETRTVLDHTVACAPCAEAWRMAAALSYEEGRGDEERALASIGSTSPAFRTIVLAMAAVLLVALGIVIGRATRWQSAAPVAPTVAVTPAPSGDTRAPMSDGARDRMAALSEQATRQSREIADLRQRLDARTPARLNVPVVALEPDELRGSTAPATIDLTPATELVLLVFAATDQRKATDYGVELVAEGNRIVWQGRGLERTVNDTFTAAVPAALFRQGATRARLYAFNGERRELLHEYRFRSVNK